jgi:hypothetical protein
VEDVVVEVGLDFHQSLMSFEVEVELAWQAVHEAVHFAIHFENDWKIFLGYRKLYRSAEFCFGRGDVQEVVVSEVVDTKSVVLGTKAQ